MKYLILFLLAAGLHTAAICQEEESAEPKTGFKKENLFFGGNIGLSFGSYTFVNLSPQVGYHLTPSFDLGAGPNFQYVSQKYYYSNGNDAYKQSLSVYGANIFARYYPFKPVFIQVQPEYNWINGKFKYYDTPNANYAYKAGAPTLLAAAGVNLNGLLISIMYDLIQDTNSPYSSKPFINFGYAF